MWIGAWHVIALVRSGDVEQTQEVMGRIVDVIVRDRKVNEVHAPDGKPLESFRYKPESPMIWKADMVIYADQVFEAHRQKDLNLLAIMKGN